jgi:coenzyme F420-0:L-glutamate ligase/coenzyme F420-1:gamma-L-glutamate ligase
VKLPTVRIGQEVNFVVLQSLKKRNLRLKTGDVIAVASKVVSTCERRVVELDQVRVTEAARRISHGYNLDQRLAAIVLQEADEILGGVRGFLLTINNGVLTANAGIDLKNTPSGTAMLWPQDADASAARLRESLEAESGTRLGAIVVDSRVTPLRLGTVGLAIGVSGLAPVSDHRGTPDIYRRKARVTQTNVVDDLASSAHLLMGETSERIGVVLVRGAPVHLQSSGDSKRARINARNCLITSRMIPVRSSAVK